MKKITWLLKQLLPLVWISEYSTNDYREIVVWRMWFGHTFDIKRWKVV